MTRKLHLLVGIPGSGKSTWVEREIAGYDEEHISAVRISRDDIRKSLLKPGDDYFARENAVFAEFIRQINDAMKLGIEHVFVDATHINAISRNKVLSRLVTDPNTILSVEVFPVSAATAIERNSNREGFARVPDSAIRNMARDFKYPTNVELAYCEPKFKLISINAHGEDCNGDLSHQ